MDKSQLKVGDRVQACKRMSWTVEQFDDFPLIVEPGDLATVTSIAEEGQLIYVEWDKDEFKHMAKTLRLSESNASPVRRVGGGLP